MEIQRIMMWVKVTARALSFMAIVFACTTDAFGWGRVGHDAVSYIAECHLTPTAKKNVEKYLGGESIVYDSSWLDLVRDTPEYGHTHSGHMYNIGKDGVYHPRERGDAVQLLNQQIKLLDNYECQSDSAVNVAIKIIVHVTGDLHCPSHPDFEEIYQWYSFNMNGSRKSFHSFWDYVAIETAHKWFYRDYQHQLDRCSDEEIAEICVGTPEDWANETARTVAVIYEWIKPDAELTKAQTNELLLKSARLADRRILVAGYRLGHLLNMLFDPEYASAHNS